MEGPLEKAEVDLLVMTPTARRRLGKYVLLGRLGAGGMGKIYLAHAPGPAGIEKLLVVKRLHGHLTNDPVLVASFLDEARLSMALNHPNIVHTYDVGDIDGRYFMVMEYIEGQNLGVVLRMAKRSGHYPKSSTWAGLFLSVLDGLHAAHTARDARGRPLQIIHRDVSPQNILITYEGQTKLVDFGIAKAAMRVNETDAGTLKGKYAYMSPEQVRGEVLDARSDVFAAGIVLWEMLAGRRLFKADNILRTVERILQEQVVSPVRVNVNADPGICLVAHKALEKNREDRFTSAAEFRDALEDALLASGARFRPAEGKELMTRLFADVITRQRAVLESTLNGVDDGGANADDDEPAVENPGDSESVSDLKMPRLVLTFSGAVETGTPSVVTRRSPLVSAEGDMPVPPMPRTKTPSTSTAVAKPPAAEATSPLVALSVLAPPLEFGPLQRTPPPQRSWLVPVGAAFIGLSLAFAVFSLVRACDTKNVVVVDAGDVAVDAGDVAVDAGDVAVDAGDVAVDTDAVVVDAGAVVVDAGDVVVDVDVDVVADAGVVEAVVVDGGVDGDEVDEPVRNSRRRKKPPVEVKPNVPVEVVEEQGFLTLDTLPWTTVYLGKKKLGETPLVKIPVPAGNIELTLINAEAGVKEAYVARVKPGEVFRTRLDLR